MTRPLCLIPLFLLPWLASDNPLAQAPPAREPLTVMTFNIRYGTAPDDDNHWTARRDMLFDLVRAQNADIIGLQEALDAQIREISAAAPGYAVVGVGRDDAQTKGEYSAILFRTDRLHVAESGTFWFSDTPEVPGSKTWGNNITRICTWARFIDRDGRGFWHFNLHLDHQSQPSRERSTELLRRRIDARAFPREPVVVTGDFNVGEGNPALRALVAAPRSEGTGGQPVAPLVDTFRVAHPDERVAGTFNGFKFGQVDGDKIDYILVQPGTAVLSAGIIRTSRNDRYPSDHFPVVAHVRLP
jgi:endonuclease/exonuclease/phosphatase family metal-dependent hydrolase